MPPHDHHAACLHSQVKPGTEFSEVHLPSGANVHSQVPAKGLSTQKCIPPTQGLLCTLNPLGHESTGQHCVSSFMLQKCSDTLYLHQALREPGSNKLIKAMQKEVQDQSQSGHWTIVTKEFSSRKTYHPLMCMVYEAQMLPLQSRSQQRKARLILDKSCQVKGRDYWDTYTPVASWLVIRWALTIPSLTSGSHITLSMSWSTHCFET